MPNPAEALKSLMTNKQTGPSLKDDANRAEEGFNAFQRMTTTIESQNSTIAALKANLNSANQTLARLEEANAALSDERDAALKAVAKLESSYENINRITTAALQITHAPLEHDAREAQEMISKLTAEPRSK